MNTHDNTPRAAVAAEDDTLAGLPEDMAAAILSGRLGYIITADDVRRVKAQS